MQRTVPGRWCLVTGCQICPRNIVQIYVVLIIILIFRILPYKILQFSAISTMYNVMHWGLAVGVLSLVAKYAARSVSQPSIHVYPELYVKNLQQMCTILWTLMSLNISDSNPFHKNYKIQLVSHPIHLNCFFSIAIHIETFIGKYTLEVREQQ